MRTTALTAIVAVPLALLTAACGGGGDDDAENAADTRRVEIAMVDLAFEPETLDVEQGTEVRFVFTNDGKVRHEAYVGTVDDQADHAAEMAEGEEADGHGEHGDGDDEPKVTVDPGERAELSHRFDEAGTFEIGCHEPGHYPAGMKVTVRVT